jgi:hypothetical protein
VNVGKTQFLVNETYNHAKNGHFVVYLAMGDSMTSDFIVKLGCIHFLVTTDEFLDNITDHMKDPEFTRILGNIELSVVPPNEILSADVKRFYKADHRLSKADVFIFDYDSNFKDLSLENMYNAHDTIYNNIYALARMDDPKLVYIASQVSKGYYSSEVIPQHALAESTRKSAIADYVVTISGITDNTNNCGIINIAKARRGTKGHTGYFVDKYGRMIEIDKNTYKSLRSQIKANIASGENDDD